jgi:hypothetical protein
VVDSHHRVGQCVKPYPDHADVNGGGPHGQSNAAADINGGKMDGFISQAVSARKGCGDPTNPACANSATPDVMSYHTQGDIQNYWAYAFRPARPHVRTQRFLESARTPVPGLGMVGALYPA